MSDEKFYEEIDRQIRAQKKKVQELRDQKIKSEAHLEDYFARKVKEEGGWAVKFNPLGNAGLPDRIVFYHGCTWLVELKTPRGTVQSHQKVMHLRFAQQGFKVRVIRNKEQVAAFIQDMLNMVG